MNSIRQFLVAVSLSILGLTVSAQDQTTANLVTNNPAAWWGIGGYSQLNGQHPITLWGCCTSYSGAAPFFDSSTTSGNGQSGQIIWSYGQATVRQTIGVNTALANSGSGIQVSGYNWGYEVRNMNGNNGQSSYSDVLTATTFLTNSVGSRILQDTRTYSGAQEWNWHGGTVSAPSLLAASTLGELGVEFSSRDAGFWGGYYGPQVRNVSLSLNYSVAPVDPCVTDPQSSPACPGYKTYYNNMWDDGWQQVDLPFAFPFYGQTFTTSYMFTNGVVGFLNPNNNSFCCSGVNLNSNPGSMWNYAIYGLQTDLGPGQDSKFWSQVGDGGTSMRYGWDRVYELGTNNASTFNIQIKDSGYIGINYQSVNSQYDITAGIAGDISQGQYRQIYNGWGGSFTPSAQYTFTGTEITDQCITNPLYSSTCPGYQQAYFNQQCSYNPLYNAQCPGYAQAYFTQQCSQNTLYDPQCPGYATAYYNYQCSANPLYHTGCPGYATAYFDQQCGLNPLYNTQCPGYADAYYVQQCTTDPLYDSGCTGYAQAYFDQQCALDALYNNQCPGYAEAYALKYVVVAKPVEQTMTEPAPDVVVVAQAEVKEARPAETVTVAAEAAPAVSASPAAAATAPVSLAAAPAPAPAAAPAEKKTEDKASAKTEPAASSSSGSSESKNKPTTTRQALAQRRLEAAREAAAESTKANPGAVSSQMDTAASMEQQAELQNVVIGAMGFVAGFDAYGRVNLQDAVGYRPFEIYRGQQNIDSPAARGLVGRSDRIHQDMVDSQYNK